LQDSIKANIKTLAAYLVKESALEVVQVKESALEAVQAALGKISDVYNRRD
jgi:hypothetical protein